MKVKNKEYSVLSHLKTNEYEEEIAYNVTSALLWLSLTSAGIAGLGIASTKEENIFKLITYGVLVSSLSIPGIISIYNAKKLITKSKNSIFKELNK